jgi:uncharacterized integral membrane protein (TIGR00698 family)
LPHNPASGRTHKLTGPLFIFLAAICLWPRIDTAMGLAAGIIFSLAFSNPFPQSAGRWSKKLLQVSVIGLGFGIGISRVIGEGKHSIVYTMIGIALTMLLGAALGRVLKVPANTSRLISFGTAICGGSAIAAMAPVIKAKEDEIAVSLATVFTLNSIALVLFPFVGHLCHLRQESFGVWAALAIHDTSSVVGAASSFGTAALAVATTVKLTRALWIMPVALGFAFFRKSNERVAFPVFILGFIAAAIVRSLLPHYRALWNALAFGSRRLLVVTLFLIGTGLTREVLKKVGFRPMLQGVGLWIIVSAGTLAIIVKGVIH